jgi:predicted RNA-binding Zn ribbon-like protein
MTPAPAGLRLVQDLVNTSLSGHRGDPDRDHHPLAAGSSGVTALISIEILLARTTDSLSRLKTCAAPECGACFYDGSPNRARVRQDTKMCGNVPNLRASRARRQAR